MAIRELETRGGTCVAATMRRRAPSHELAERLTATLDSITDGFLTMDREWRFTYLNRQAEAMLRRPREELLGQVAWEVFAEARGSIFQVQYEKAVRTNAPVEFEAFYAPIGLWLLVRAFPSAVGLAVSFTDVTARVLAQQEASRVRAELEHRVQERTARLEEARHEMEAFSYSIAHDLRAPLAAIGGFGHMVEELERDKLGERSLRYLRRIRAAVGQMSGMTDGLLALSRLSRAEVRRESMDLSHIAGDIVAGLRDSAPHRHVDVRIAARLPAHGDRALLTQALQNLLANAWKFTSRTADACIEVGLRVEQAAAVYFVRDNGAGFDMRHASRLFGAFERMHTPMEFEGHGIGLALVHRIVSRHGGRIWADAKPGEGATFSFTLG